MAISVERVSCECGKEYVVTPDDQRPSIRCHMCGRLIDLTYRKAAAGERQAAERAAVRQASIDEAARVSFAGLRFSGVYRTPSPVQFDSAFVAALGLSVRFNSNLVAEYVFRILDDDNGVTTEVDRYSGQAGYDIVSEETIRLVFDIGAWDCEWEGFVRGDVLQLSYRIKESFGLSSGPICVREGEAHLQLEHSQSDE